jgi:hypothetical protein
MVGTIPKLSVQQFSLKRPRLKLAQLVYDSHAERKEIRGLIACPDRWAQGIVKSAKPPGGKSVPQPHLIIPDN